MLIALRASLFALVSIALSGAGHAPPPRLASFTPEQRVELDHIGAYLNAIRTLQGHFEQLDPNGAIEQGEFYLSKPGRMRFAYQPPNPLLVVSDGITVAVMNTSLKTVDRYPLADTPLDLILGEKIDLNHNLAVTGMADEAAAITVHARSQSSHAQGDISIEFSRQPLELRQWTVMDAQGLSTTVLLKDVQTGVSLPDSLFVLHDAKSPFTRKAAE
ncbi:MAG: outer-membrane lipoprotein carrier protein LolA [Alphaproteobacteria bacterium]|nr:outer-membrane lipoprotein carrier protein LolA [Alphaproteobacteria bacterium]